MKSEIVSKLKHSLLWNIRPEIKNRPDLRLSEEDFVQAFDVITAAMAANNKIDDKVWAYVLLGLSIAARGKVDGQGQKENVRTDLG